MEWQPSWGIVVLGAALAYVWVRYRRWRRTVALLEHVRGCAAEDVTALRDDLGQLAHDLAGVDLRQDAGQHYRRARQCYESAGRAIDELDSVEAAGSVTEAVANGRYAMACARAEVSAQPMPESRVPCFFDPRHGPSVSDVAWESSHDQPFAVPACAEDAARIAAGGEPEIRYIWTGWRRVPYWQAGSAFTAYSSGYFLGEWSGSKAAALAMIDLSLVGGGRSLGLPGDPTFLGIGGGGGDGGGC